MTEFETVMDATNRRGRAIKCRISMDPLLESPSTIGGAVVLVEEIEGSSNGP